ncbi:MAG: T9SS type A sorting domain-containing protein [bacterium]
MNLKTLIIAMALILTYGTIKAEIITVTDSWINTGEKKYMTSENIYLLEGLVFVEDGAELHIESGTVIKGKPGQEHNASALVIAKGGKIFAEGTPTKPIIFTAEADDPYDLADLPITETGQWGGVIILGKAQTNIPGGVGQIEGIAETESRGQFGMPEGEHDNEDNSGVMRYVSIRHGGTDIGDANEINGLTLGAVGRGTTIDHIEVWYNADDGFEFFGGTVNTSHLVSAFNKDDSYDYDMGFNGRGQFWVSIQADNRGNCAGEHDGGDKPEDGTPFAIPVIYNATYIGSGVSSANTKSIGLHIRDNAGGKYFNSIFTEFTGKGLEIEDLTSGEDSKARFEAGDLVLNNNLWWNIGNATTTVQTIAPDVTGSNAYSQDFVRTYLSDVSNNNWIENPMLMGISRTQDGGLDPRPALNSPAFTKPVHSILSGEDFFVNAPYIGAFGPGDLWLDNWTFLSKSGILKPLRQNVVNVTDSWINAGETKYMTSDNIYLLDKLVFVEDGAKLYIEPGTVIKGKPGQEHDASALVIAKGGQIFALGTPTQPIIFTAEADDPYDLNDLPITETGQWGGVILLGKAQTNIPGGIGQIEGIAETEPRGGFGMPEGEFDNHDNSGIMRFVSIRHGGTDIGDANEINGLTFGAVGDGTTIEFVEVWYNADDGFEFFGGTVNTKFLISAFNKDDSFDYDIGFNGKGQNWFSIQAPNRGNCAGEHDGGDKPEDGKPFAIPYIYNATYIGSGVASANTKSIGLHIRDNAGSKYFNSIFTETTGKGLEIEDLTSGEDSRNRFEAMDIVFNNNIWWNIGSTNTTVETIAPDVSGSTPYAQDFVRTYLSNAATMNNIIDPQLYGISRDQDMGLDPRPMPSSPAFTSQKAPIFNAKGINNTFFHDAPYIGAFGVQNWLADWTFLSFAGIASNVGGGIPMIKTATGIQDPTVDVVDATLKINAGLSCYPNPVKSISEVQFFVEQQENVKIDVYNLLGVKVQNLVNQAMEPGNWGVKFDANNLNSGTYFIRMELNNKVITELVVIE